MSRVAWSFSGVEFPINPYEDSGWIWEHVSTEDVPIQATKSTLQFGGRKSPRRQVKGYIWGSICAGWKSQLENWRKDKTNGTLVDHLGDSQSAVLMKFEPELVNDPQEWVNGRQTYRYVAEFVGT